MKAAAALALLLACCIGGCGGAARGSTSAAAAGSAPQTAARSGSNNLRTVILTSGGHRREYLLYVPPGDSKKHRLPLVLVFHGALDTATQASTETNLLSVARTRHNMILAFLQGYENTWNEGAGHTAAEQAGINDVRFTTLVLREIETRYHVNDRRVLATGLSNGALLTELLGCRLARQLTAIVPVEGQLPVSVANGCRPAVPIAVYELHGTADQAIPYMGGKFAGVGGGTTVLSATASAERWSVLDRCAVTPRTSQTGNIVLTTYSGCRDGVRVTLASIQGGGHVWPDDFAHTVANALSSISGRRSAAPA